MSKWYNGYYGGGYYGGYSFRKKTVGEFKDEVSGTTPTLGRSQVAVTFTGKEAGIQGDHTINFPYLSSTDELTEKNMDTFRGYVDQASSMLRFTDMDIYRDIEAIAEKNPLLLDVFKNIEASRVAREYCHNYVGAKRNIAALRKEVTDMALSHYEGSTDKNPQKLLGSAISALCMDKMGGSHTWWQQQRLGKYVDMKKMAEYAEEVWDLQDTDDAYQFALRIIEDLTDETPPDEEPQGGEGQGGGEGDNKDEEKQEGQGQFDPNAPMSPDDFFDFEDVVNKAVDDINDDAAKSHARFGGDIPYRVFTTDYDRVMHWSTHTDPKHEFVKDIAPYNKIMDQMDNTVATLKRKIELLIQATRKVDWDRFKEDGRFDSRRLVGAYNREKNVFKVRDDASDLDTALSIVVDMSGSMYFGNRSGMAMQTCGVLAECLSKIGVPFEILGFSTNDNVPRDKLWPDYSDYIKAQENFVRTPDGMDIYEFKRFSDRLFDAKQYMHHMARHPCGNDLGFRHNIDGESIEIAGRRLMKRPEKRKIMFVLSDGMPECSTYHGESMYSHLKKVVYDLGKRVDVVGVGIQTDSVSRFYPNWIRVSDVKDLPVKGLQLLENAILQKNKDVHDANTEKFNKEHFKEEKREKESA